METARALFDAWEPLIRKHAPTEHVEIEIRLGRKTPKKFDTNVGRETFQKLLRALSKYEGWESKTEKTYSVYYGSSNKRITVDEATDEATAVIKSRVAVSDFDLPNCPFDVRLGVSREVPYEQDDEEMASVKEKHRWSFVRKNLSIDLSQIKGDPEDPDSDEDTTWHVELEIMNPRTIGDRDQLFAILYKIFNLLDCV
jgi:hypothetical protein